MARIEKTVFISYRRTNAPWALAIFQNLHNNGYDVFFDYEGIASGDFEGVILGNIRARAHFIVLLTPSALERCSEPTDWLRREIEEALAIKRNIVPLMLEGFDFGTPAIANQLTGKLAALRKYNALDVPASYFMAAMDRLRERFLNVPLEGVLHPASPSAERATKKQQAAADTAPVVQEKELTAQQWFERGFDTKDLDEKVRFYSQAIRLKPDYASAFNNRGLALHEKGDIEGAMKNYNEAIRLKPDNAAAYYNRGRSRQAKGDPEGAVKDCTEAIRLKPDYAHAFLVRGLAREATGDLEGALKDYNEAIRFKPDDTFTLYYRAIFFGAKENYEASIADFQKYLDLGGGVQDENQQEVEEKIRDLRKILEGRQGQKNK
ncbi:MAG TPA: tetratricopeptide repeat protein [Candidatus Angelobacter sp.]|nr:tetratricopeptide repeat protein [Candidatus Angelobacter sp.]